MTNKTPLAGKKRGSNNSTLLEEDEDDEGPVGSPKSTRLPVRKGSPNKLKKTYKGNDSSASEQHSKRSKKDVIAPSIVPENVAEINSDVVAETNSAVVAELNSSTPGPGKSHGGARSQAGRKGKEKSEEDRAVVLKKVMKNEDTKRTLVRLAYMLKEMNGPQTFIDGILGLKAAEEAGLETKALTKNSVIMDKLVEAMNNKTRKFSSLYKVAHDWDQFLSYPESKVKSKGFEIIIPSGMYDPDLPVDMSKYLDPDGEKTATNAMHAVVKTLKADVKSLIEAIGASGSGNPDHPCGSLFSFVGRYKIHAIIALTLCEAEFQTLNKEIGEGDKQQLLEESSPLSLNDASAKKQVKETLRNIQGKSSNAAVGVGMPEMLSSFATDFHSVRQTEERQAQISILEKSIQANLAMAAAFASFPTKRDDYLHKAETDCDELERLKKEFSDYLASSASNNASQGGKSASATSTNDTTTTTNITTPTTTFQANTQGSTQGSNKSDNDENSDSTSDSGED